MTKSHDAPALLGQQAPFEKAPFGIRAGAALVDFLVTVPALLIWTFIVLAYPTASTPFRLTMGLAGSLASIWALHYAFTKDGRPGGQSMGKKMMGLMVLHIESNLPCSPRQSALRNLVLILISIPVPPISWLIEPIVSLSTDGGRRLGDFAAGTQVIRRSDYRPGR
jgi:uncharacterized RDD family membrane protein YckC